MDALYERAQRPRVSQSFAWAWCVWETMMKPLGAHPHQVAHDPRFEKFGPGIQIYRPFLRYAFEHRLPVTLGVAGKPYKKGDIGIDVVARVMPSSPWGAMRTAIRRLRAWKGRRHAARAAGETQRSHRPEGAVENADWCSMRSSNADLGSSTCFAESGDDRRRFPGACSGGVSELGKLKPST